LKLRLYDAQGKSLGHIDVLDGLFDARPNPALVHQVVVGQQANARQGTVGTKTRAQVSGGGRKPWRQKGTGRARVGSIRSPIWRGGGVTFGPSPRSFAQRTPKRMRRAALKASLSTKAREGELVVVDRLRLPEPKTKHFVAMMEALGVSGSVLLVGDGTDPSVLRCARNVPKLKMMPAFQLSAVDLLRHSRVVMTLGAVRQAERIWGGPFVRSGRVLDDADDPEYEG
jgi:large subunit ribosomal protein L4